jgi:hypothetical protein
MLVDILGKLVLTWLVSLVAFFAAALWAWHDAPEVPHWADVVFTSLIGSTCVGFVVWLLLVIWGV